MADSVATRVRFGPFTLDLRSCELHKGATRLKVPDQSIEILKALLERPGDLVTREELRQRLWPADTFVDFEHGLNAAVRRLRDALGDSADAPQYIETLPRRGYRFVGSVAPSAVAPAAFPVAPEVRSPPSPMGLLRTHRLSRASATSVALAAVLFTGFAMSMFWRQSRPFGSMQAVPLTSYPGLESDPSLSPDGTHVAFMWTGAGRAKCLNDRRVKSRSERGNTSSR